MSIHHDAFSVTTQKKLEIIDITRYVRSVVHDSQITHGLISIWIRHTTAALMVNERDPSLWHDILSAFTELVPLNAKYQHNMKYAGIAGEQNAHAHILNALIKPDVTIPLRSGNIALGTWQAILFLELDGPRKRMRDVQVIGEK